MLVKTVESGNNDVAKDTLQYHYGTMIDVIKLLSDLDEGFQTMSPGSLKRKAPG